MLEREFCVKQKTQTNGTTERKWLPIDYHTKKKKTWKWDLKTNYGQWMVSEMDKAQAYSDENYY